MSVKGVVIVSQNTLACNGANRHGLLTARCSTCNSEVIFNAGAALASHQHQLSVAVRNVYSSSSQLLFLGLLCDCSLLKYTVYAGNKKPLHLRGLASLLIPLISRTIPPELAPFLHPCRWVAGLQRAVSLHLS